MKIAVVGTSNAVMKAGWANQLRARLPEDWTLDNLSIGGSASLHGSFTVTRADVARNYDVALIDFAINDQQMIDIRNMTPGYVAGAFAALLRCFAEPGARCTPVVILIPQRDLLAHGRQDQARDAMVGLCERYGVAYIDLYHELRRLQDEDGVDPAGCFSDWTHLRPFAQAALAEAALRAVRALGPGRTPAARVLEEAPRCYAVPDADVTLSEETRETLGTSHARFEVRRIGPGAQGVIRNAPWLCGIVHWIAPDSGALCFDGVRARVKKGLRKEWTGMFGLTLFCEPLETDPAGAPVRFGDLEGYAFERSFGMTPKTPVDGARADIVGFVACDRDPAAVGDALLEAIGKTPAAAPACRLDPALARPLLSGWVNHLRALGAPPPPPAAAGAAADATMAVADPEPPPRAEVAYLDPVTRAMSVRVPDGGGAAVRLPASAGVLIVTSEASLLRCVLGYRAGPQPQLHNLGVPTPNVALVAGPLDEVVARDKHMTFGLTADGRLQIENRRGGTVAMTLLAIG